MTNVEFESILLNFGFGSKVEKKDLLRQHPDKQVYMDLTCYNPEEFYAEFPNLKGAFAALFCDSRKLIEVHYREPSESAQAKFVELGFTPVETSFVSTGFTFPRTLAQIINEAYFALEDGIASAEDIDRAMRFGVNYPQGPFQWARGKELWVKTLLEELHRSTGDERYQPCRLLGTEKGIGS